MGSGYINKKLWGIISAVLALCLIVFFGWFFLKSDETEAVERFAASYEDQNYEEIYEHLSESDKSEYSTEEVVDRYEKIYSDLEVDSIELGELTLDEESSSDETKIYRGDWTMYSSYGDLDKELEVALSEEDGEWHVDWSSDLIIPELSGNTVEFNFTQGERGEIQDNSGEPLAFNGYKEVVGYIAGEVSEEELTALSDELEMGEDRLSEIYNEEWIDEGMFVPLKELHRFSEEDKSVFEENNLQIDEQPSREYALEEQAFHLLGYVGEITEEELENMEDRNSGDIVGKRGLEQLYDERLQPTNGHMISLVDDYDREVDVLFEEDAEDGEDLVLTIDGDLQSDIYESLEEDSGASVAMDPNNGDMLATVSYPSPSPYDFMFGLTQEDFETLETDEDNPMINKFHRATSPGSTQKILTALVALNTDDFNRDDTREISGQGWQLDESWGGYNVNRYHTEDGAFDLQRAITSSDNIYFAQTAIELGAERFVEGMEELGIGMDYDTDYPIYTSQVSNDGEIDRDVLLADTSYGQGELMISPIQITAIYGGVVNGGDIYVPHILQESEDEVQIESIASEADLDYLEQAMRAVVTDYHSEDTERDYASFAGKTGTSEDKVSQETRGSETGWFIGYDQDEKDMMLSLYVEDVEDRGMSEYSARKFAEIQDKYRDENE